MFDSTKLASQKLANGEIIVLLDDATTKFAGFMIADAACISAKSVSIMVNQGKGIVLAALPEGRVESLGIPPMSGKSRSGAGENFRVSVEARKGVTTGISAEDRATTLRTLANTSDSKRDLVMPGHIMPLSVKDGGVLVRTAYPEAAIDLARLSNQRTSSCVAICHCLNSSGEIMDESELLALASRHNYQTVRISDIVQFQLKSRTFIEQVSEADLPTTHAGMFRAVCFRSKLDGTEHFALIKGDIKNSSKGAALVRVQAENKFMDLLATEEMGPRSLIGAAMSAINKKGRGVFIYIRHPKEGMLAKQIGVLQSKHSTIQNSRSSQMRELGIGAQILSHLGLKQISLLSNSTRNLSAVNAFDIQIVERVPFA